MAKCKHNYILIHKGPFETVYHCTLCHNEVAELKCKKEKEVEKVDE